MYKNHYALRNLRIKNMVGKKLMKLQRMLSGVESEEEQRIRFQVELEFVQCLGNPNYLNHLAQRDVFKNPAFINYLKYLLYWKLPEYAKFLKYPQCLYILESLQSEHFRNAMACQPNCKFVEDQMILQWQYYVRKRCRMQSIVVTDPAESATGQEDSS